MVSPECFEAQIEPKIKSLLDFKQNVKNRMKGLELVGQAMLNMSEEQIFSYFKNVIENLACDVNWIIRQQIAKFIGQLLNRSKKQEDNQQG